ncbi:hypothetical protein BH11VER1_BH11VER1_25620 [soil metagenome]
MSTNLKPRTSRPLPAGHRRRSRAFTLLEVVIALTMLAMFSGTLFTLIRGSVKAATEIQQLQKDNDQVNRFIAICRQAFQNLPITAILTLTVTEKNTPMLQELTISGAPEAFPFGISPISYKETILGIRPDLAATEASESGLRVYYLGVSREDIVPEEVNRSAGVTRSVGDGVAAPDDQGRYWMPLLPAVTSLTWRFYKEEEDTWEEEWDSTQFPPLIEMNLLLADRTQPIRVVFALPATKLSAADPKQAPKQTTTQSSVASPSTNNGGGGNNRGGNNEPQQGGDQRGGSGNDRGQGRGGNERGRGGNESQNQPRESQPNGGARGSTGGPGVSGGSPGGAAPSGGR